LLACPRSEPVTAQSAVPVTVTVDVATRGEPISKHLYGQFIEHLGRCIYGGLWAEMLEDRKFYYPVTGDAPAWEMFTPRDTSWEGAGRPYELLVRSPWLVLGDKRAVSMSRDRAWTGEHSPHLALPGSKGVGIAQERLGLIDGREYVGRVVLTGDASAGPVEVSLVSGAGASQRETIVITAVARDYATHALRFRAQATTDNGRLEIVGRGSGSLLIGAVSLMPVDNVLGWRADTLARLRELDSPVYRWPGGNFVSGYDWRDGVGDTDRRPPRKNPAWKGIESNDVGLHEFIDLCRLIDAEPYVAVSTGLGVQSRPPIWCSTPTAPRTRLWGGSAPGTDTPARSEFGYGPWATKCTAIGSSGTCRSTATSRSTAASSTPCARSIHGFVSSPSAPSANGARPCSIGRPRT
jgi:alpha-N-arabinofuranosidase